jgi:hypothetical protein
MTDYPQWSPEEFEDTAAAPIDPLAEQVASAEDRDVLRDPEADAEPKIVRVFNGREAGVGTDVAVDHGSPQAAPPTVERVEQRGHLDPPPPSTDPLSDDQLDRLEGVPHHPGILRGHDDRG